MLKNDFRRSLILLRPLRRGMSGHVRLERRTLQGSMRFTVQGTAQGKLHALLLAQAPQGFTVYKLGALATDSRGQSGLTATFDPRNLQGLDLDQYTLVALVDDGAVPEMVLSGLVNGSREIDWAAAAQAATAPYQKVEAAAQAKPEAAPPQEGDEAPKARDQERDQERARPDQAQPQSDQAVAQAKGAEEAVQPADCCCDLNDQAAGAQEPVAIIAKAVADEEPAQPQAQQGNADSAQAQPAEEAQPVEEAPPPEEAPPAEEAPPVEVAPPPEEAPPLEEAQPAGEAQPEQAAQIEAGQAAPMACVLLALDLTLNWPEEIAALKPLFEQNPASDGFALEDFVFVEAPLPAEDGAQGQCAIGLKARDGVPVSVCYALPGEFSLEPPPGLEGYEYLGGWWYTVLQAQPEVNALGETVGEETPG